MNTATHPMWRKSRRSNSQGNCVEIANLGDAVGIRDSKRMNGPVLALTPEAWQTLLRGLKLGESRL